MKKNRENGFVLLIAIASLTLIGISVLILSQGSRVMHLETNEEFGLSCEQNLTASALAWANDNIKVKNDKILDKTIELDTSGMDMKNSRIAVTIVKHNDDQVKARIEGSCSSGQRFFKINKEYLLSNK